MAMGLIELAIEVFCDANTGLIMNDAIIMIKEGLSIFIPLKYFLCYIITKKFVFD
jgi:hypothetical protein